MAPNRQPLHSTDNEQLETMLGLLVVFGSMGLVIIYYLLLKWKGETSCVEWDVYPWKDMYLKKRTEGSTVSDRSYNTFSGTIYNVEPKGAPGMRSDMCMTSDPDAEVESHERSLERSMQLAANMIKAMKLRAVPWGRSFSRATLFLATLWQDVERRSYFFEVFDLIAYDPAIFLKLGEEEFLSDKPEPLLLVADTLWDKTTAIDEAKNIVSELKLRTYFTRSMSYPLPDR